LAELAPGVGSVNSVNIRMLARNNHKTPIYRLRQITNLKDNKSLLFL
jgi:hypothetical protein